MPLIKPEIQKVLRSAGLLPEEKTEAVGTMNQGLESAGLTIETVADELASLALRSNNEALRLRALETVLKVKGALKETPSTIPSFTVVIQASGDHNLNQTHGVSPNLFPRQSLQLLDKTEKEKTN